VSTELNHAIVRALKTVYDPEIPVDIWELGLVYDVIVEGGSDVTLKMTLTSPHCPVAESLPTAAEVAVAAVPGVRSVTVELVWDPPWGPEMLSEAARLELGMD
jgi:FeS assembly SUF system protein